MKQIILFGAGRSATYLIDYLLEHAEAEEFQLVLADSNIEIAELKIGNHPRGRAVACDINDTAMRQALIAQASFVISMLPAFLHFLVAKDCLLYGKDMATASYLSDEIKAMEPEITAKGLVFANELGLDPGIDHMSAMKLLDEIKSKGGQIISFKSYTGGLVAKESDDNPWHYKVSWNPRNVILAGQCTSQYLENGEIKFLPYSRLFSQSEEVDVIGHGNFSMYVNRDSIKYVDLYRLDGINTMIRGTFRGEGYCEAWSVLIDLGMTDDSTKLSLEAGFSIANFTKSFLISEDCETKEKIERTIRRNISPATYERIEYLQLFSDECCPLSHPTPAQVLEYIIVNKWVLRPNDKDLIVMQHEVKYRLDNEVRTVYSTLYREGKNDIYTAMAETVGLPLAIYTKLRLRGMFNKPGVFIPVEKEIYEPILKELSSLGIHFMESENV